MGFNMISHVFWYDFLWMSGGFPKYVGKDLPWNLEDFLWILATKHVDVPLTRDNVLMWVGVPINLFQISHGFHYAFHGC